MGEGGVLRERWTGGLVGLFYSELDILSILWYQGVAVISSTK